MSEWPPAELKPIRAAFAEWDAWMTGDRARLEAAGSAHGGGGYHSEGATEKRFGSGPIGRLLRRFWGKSSSTQTEPRVKVHAPLAADIARASSDLLFAEPPTITGRTPEKPEQETAQYAIDLAAADATTQRLQSYLDKGLLTVLSGAAEVGAGLGGVFLRVTWDAAKQRVFAVRIDADAAIPQFMWGELQRVTFFRQLSAPGERNVLRHLEIHEQVDRNAPTDPEGERTGDVEMVGIIRHQLWRGTVTDLGNQVPLTEAPSLAGLLPLLVDGDTISSLTPGLCVVYVPNITPNTLWRNVPCGKDLGAPDIAGCEDFLDRLDASYSSLLEELELAKARITVPEQWLDTHAPGKGQSFDTDRRVFTGLAIPPTDGQAGAEMFQPAIRVDEHLRVIQELTEVIIRRAGYSAATFGEDEDGAATATEVNSKNSRSRLTRNKKIRNWQPKLVELLTKMLAVDVAMQWADEKVDPDLVDVSFPQPAQTPLELANMIDVLNRAGAISTWMKVATAHPDWNDGQVEKEIERIREDNPDLVNPEAFGVGGQDLQTMDPAEVKAAADAMGVLIRAGVEPAEAAQRVGLGGLPFTGAVPTSLRLPEKDAASLEQA